MGRGGREGRCIGEGRGSRNKGRAIGNGNHNAVYCAVAGVEVEVGSTGYVKFGGKGLRRRLL